MTHWSRPLATTLAHRLAAAVLVLVGCTANRASATPDTSSGLPLAPAGCFVDCPTCDCQAYLEVRGPAGAVLKSGATVAIAGALAQRGGAVDLAFTLHNVAGPVLFWGLRIDGVDLEALDAAGAPTATDAVSCRTAADEPCADASWPVVVPPGWADQFADTAAQATVVVRIAEPEAHVRAVRVSLSVRGDPRYIDKPFEWTVTGLDGAGLP